MRQAAALLVAVALVVSGCGRKAPPLAPELVQPEPPETLAATATPEGVRLTWLRPRRYSGGQRMNDLGGFVIERASGEDEPLRFVEIGRLELDDQTRFRQERRLEWVDRQVTPDTRYRYRLTAYTLDGYRSPPAGPVGVRFGPPAAGETP